MTISKKSGLLIFGVTSLISASVMAADRQIEEVVVTAEKVESTVSDTSISITAFSADTIEEFGMQSADDMVNYIPATTRDAYDIRIRGVGRNFRSLGGDPGVATYYNGVYSPDFGIAASENALYDIKRIEVLRGPQGTLYGRNAIGGALNYITNDPTFDWTGNVRTQIGSYNDLEIYGVISGPIIEDKLAFRFLGVKRDRDGMQTGLNGTVDTNSVDDKNISLAITWNITDSLTAKFRGNDRTSNRIIGINGLVAEGPMANAGDQRERRTDNFAWGLSQVAAGTGMMQFTGPNGNVLDANYVRPGQDRASAFLVNPAFNNPQSVALSRGATTDNPNGTSITGSNGAGECAYPYTRRNCQHELFDHQATQNELVWDVNEDLSFKYILGTNEFEYTFNIMVGYADNPLTQPRSIVIADTKGNSHEIQMVWSPTDSLSITSGIYYFEEDRIQDFSVADTVNFVNPVDYDNPGFLAAQPYLPGMIPDHVGITDAAVGTTSYGMWLGHERGDYYTNETRVYNEATAIFTQATWEMNKKFSIVMGLRYAEDYKEATEFISGHAQVFDIGFASAFRGFVDGLFSPTGAALASTFGFGPIPATPGLTDLGWTNIAMGNASWNWLAPGNEFTPTCALEDQNTCSNPLLLQGLPISYNSHLEDSDTWSDTNYRINLDWTPTDDILVYFSVTTGYRAGGYSLGVLDANLIADNSDVKPAKYDKETVTAYEIGYKGMHLDNTLQLNMSLYTYDYENYQDQVSFFDPRKNDIVSTVQNAPKARNTGFEVEAMWLPTDELTLGGNYSFTDTEYTDDYLIAVTDNPALPASLFGGAQGIGLNDAFPEGLTCFSHPFPTPTCEEVYFPAPSEPDNPTSGAAAYDVQYADTFVVNAKGSQLKGIPEHKATVWGSYALSSSVGDFTFFGSYSYTGEYYSEGYRRELDTVPARFRTDVSVSWTDRDGNWRIRAFVDNITDELNNRGVSTGTEGNNWRQSVSRLDSRFYGVDIRYRFGD